MTAGGAREPCASPEWVAPTAAIIARPIDDPNSILASVPLRMHPSNGRADYLGNGSRLATRRYRS